MNPVLGLVQSLAIQQLQSQFFPIFQRSATEMALYGVAAIMILTGAGFLIASGYLWLETFQPDFTAAATTGLGLITCALFIGLGCALYHSYRRHRFQKRRKAFVNQIENTVRALELPEEWEQLIRDHPASSVLTSAVAGYVIGEKIIN